MKTILAVILILNLSCSEKKVKNDKLCLDFINLNKGKSFKILFEISTLNSRLSSIYDKNKSQNKIIFNDLGLFCKGDSIMGNYITLPLQINHFTDKNINYYKKDLFYFCKNKGITDLNFYKKFVLDFNNEINSITTPKYHNNSNVMIDSNPNSGRFIEFILNDKSKVYYLESENSLNEKWKIEFEKFNKIDKNWFYKYSVD